ncbi:centrosomal protein of 41 kDa [Eurytemora carolleeae]|uniref:centrosomal protein of 41 kDa n=1 Tax=Eurytemora carolleeae TaxID=1294199 RepID=UPI000C7733CB|nr:centrosomal protein of 41 kDa [Eurytemora carolleeae]XP_023328279.1 centrosomal protein of 41 kDa [Eurytemora carolleeae]XP_023328280.1 centrosomal protein of 41 kDa [Eurytemora carolleeae]XP_023328281.1 centrosomal protein of 41 kDa [Eurytemora carolleeae]XP_023328282.1 centrosomal protein of 41 kDa [Eurytemora carolleeae]XP_023328283.1 centrosomal protein of 41 kDa [Eurytemora carolleeae]XP_023328284.1 centrosomal protein of 41 kDa [Eurytemora carolleeae]XP_023328286.1 centrosomal prote|eukprot:XP_023328278.1 centrosomal protein of 41 kDa-like [Eurytemora affinis]
MEVRRMRPKPKISPLDRKIKPNPRYSAVEPVVNTGSNLRTELEKLDEIHQFYKFRNDEIFRRITINNLVSLMIEVCKLEHQLYPGVPGVTGDETLTKIPDYSSDSEEDTENKVEEDPDIDTLIRSQFNPEKSKPSSRKGTARSVTSVTMGVGEMDRTSPVIPEETPIRPFLLLDLRDTDLFSRSHISLAVNYPAIRLNRAFDYETREMLRLKNKKNAVIVLYDDDESIASRCATTLTQRGYDNVFLLSGGLRVATLRYPESLVSDRDLKGIEEGDIMVLEKLLEENIVKGSSSFSSRLTGRMGSRRSVGTSYRSLSLDRVHSSGMSSTLDRGNMNRRMIFDAPVRTSTALGKKLNRFL